MFLTVTEVAIVSQEIILIRPNIVL